MLALSCVILRRYFDALFVRDRRRGLLHFRGQRSYDVENLEFLCPLCETLSNTVIPMVPPLASLVREGYAYDVATKCFFTKC